ncbi:MAG TPA: MFS transporter [Rhizomicrobium sp.]|nr:MFS transporter [Rhizomicrobium sp.]
MAYFRNRTVNLLNLHYGMHAVALSGGAAFFSVYLLKAGVPVESVLLSLAAILAGRFVLRPVVIPLGVRFGMRALVLSGTVLNALQYPLLAEVGGVGPALFALCAVSALGETIYWSSYHAYFAALGDAEHRGHQTGMREAIAAGVGIVSPVATSFALVAFGPRAAFGATAVVLVLSAVPLLFTPDVKVARQAPGALRAALPGVKLLAADGWIATGFYFVWQLVLFLTLGADFVAFGFALALAALAGAIGGLLLGRHIDAGHGGRAAWIGCGAIAAVVALRAFVPGYPVLAVAAAAAGSLAACLYIPVLMTAVYNQAQRAPCTLRFHVASEGGWDIGGASGLLAAALLVHIGQPLAYGVLLGLVGAAGALVQLRRYYRS